MDARSEKNLAGVHPDLQRVVRRAYDRLTAAHVGFTVIEGLRTPARQRELVAAGASKTMHSRHITGHAVDLMATVAGRGRWDWALYPPLAKVVKEAAEAEGVRIVWGGDWPRFRDGPHFELDREVYP